MVKRQKTVTIATQEGVAPFRVRVIAQRGVWGVTPHVMFSDDYSVTHLPSGVRVPCEALSLKDARGLMRALPLRWAARVRFDRRSADASALRALPGYSEMRAAAEAFLATRWS